MVIADNDISGGLAMRAPMLDVKPDWRKPVIAAWEYLTQYYSVTENRLCSTRIQISLMPSYTLEQLKRIASSAIYFEPAIEALVPALHRRGADWARSNWLDSPYLARKGKSRVESIEAINAARCEKDLVRLMQREDDKCYVWNFCSVIQMGTVEFRKAPGSKTSAAALSWAQFVLNFVQASLECGTLQWLQEIPATIGGLKRFVQRINDVEGVNDPELLKRVFHRKRENEAIGPTHFPDGRLEGSELSAQLDSMVAREVAEIKKSAITAREPYF
jgi:Putative amidoligase enzyme